MILGFAVFGFAIQATVQAGLGVSPWDVFHLGVARHTGLTLGEVSELAGLVIVAVAWPLGIRPTLGTLLNVLLIGYFVDQVGRWGLVPRPASPAWALIEVTVGYLLFGAGTGLYISADVGAGPRDSLMLAVTSRTGRSVAVVRTALEASVFVTGWLLGGPVGWGTLIGVALIGTTTHAFLHLFNRLAAVFWPGAGGFQAGGEGALQERVQEGA